MVGVDIIEIKKITTACERTPRFLQRVFSESERDYAQKKGERQWATLAGIFAAKEAISKALGCGLSGYEYCNVEIMHTQSGQPQAIFKSRAKELLGEKTAHISITHSDDFAAAICLITDK